MGRIVLKKTIGAVFVQEQLNKVLVWGGLRKAFLSGINRGYLNSAFSKNQIDPDEIVKCDFVAFITREEKLAQFFIFRTFTTHICQ